MTTVRNFVTLPKLLILMALALMLALPSIAGADSPHEPVGSGIIFESSNAGGGIGVGRLSSIAATDASTIYISHTNASGNTLQFTESNDGGTTFTSKTIDSPSVGRWSSIAAVEVAQNDDTIFISYFDKTLKDLKLARSTDGGTSFAISVVDSAGGVGEGTRLC